jgi:hypothetical protein
MITTSDVVSPSSAGNAGPTGAVAAQSEGGQVTEAFCEAVMSKSAFFDIDRCIRPAVRCIGKSREKENDILSFVLFTE